jgi:deoxyribodipyrimidine photolyase
LVDLDASLRSKGSGLVFRIGIPEKIIPALVAELGVDKVFAKKEVAHEEKAVQADVERKSCGSKSVYLRNLARVLCITQLICLLESEIYQMCFSAFRNGLKKKHRYAYLVKCLCN